MEHGAIAYAGSLEELLYRVTDETVGPGKTCIAWRPNGNTLAMASANKSVILYDKKGAIVDVLDVTGKIPVLGKHQRKVTGVVMTKQDKILCCSDDSTITGKLL
ncbi:hypothetical protein RB195_012112 [Necator americanus]|uniref:Anaphase-promoting complex subunit 4 WD40 domain-containing protein n=1 Tax=Necator americanus TaxID=51031 RepID=A0ABR1D5R5_NECAM